MMNKKYTILVLAFVALALMPMTIQPVKAVDNVWVTLSKSYTTSYNVGTYNPPYGDAREYNEYFRRVWHTHTAIPTYALGVRVRVDVKDISGYTECFFMKVRYGAVEGYGSTFAIDTDLYSTSYWTRLYLNPVTVGNPLSAWRGQKVYLTMHTPYNEPNSNRFYAYEILVQYLSPYTPI